MMLNRFVGFFICVLTIAVPRGIGQGLSDTIEIGQVQVVSSRVQDYAIGASCDNVDSVILEVYELQSLPVLLEAASSLTMNSYGPGGLCTFSARGGRSSQSTIVWNDVNLQNSMSGSINLSGFSSFMVDNLSIQQGGASSMFGSGAATGIIHLNNNSLLQSKNTVSVTGSIGSYGNYTEGLKLKTGNQRYAVQLKAFHNQSTNNFDFYNITKAGSPLEKQENAQLKQYQLAMDHALRTSDNAVLLVNYWYSNYDKNLQTPMSYSSSDAQQKDENHLFSARWRYYGKFYELKIGGSAVSSIMNYSNPILPENERVSGNKLLIINQEAENRFNFNSSHHLNIGYSISKEQAESTGYTSLHERNSLAVFGNYKWTSKKDARSKAIVSYRKSFVDGKQVPFVYSFAGNVQLADFIGVNANYSKNYQLPTFNDLYWKPTTFAAGNAKLKPSFGYSYDLGLNVALKKKSLQYKSELSFFKTNTRQMIVWLDSASLWTPKNKDVVKTAGIEFAPEVYLQKGRCHVKVSYRYTFTHSIILEEGDDYNEQRLTYIPRHKNQFNAQLGYRKFSLFYSFKYQSKRYYDYKNTLPSHRLHDVSLAYNFMVGRMLANASLSVYNLMNESYQVMRDYAMPIRNYLFTIKISYN